MCMILYLWPMAHSSPEVGLDNNKFGSAFIYVGPLGLWVILTCAPYNARDFYLFKF